MRVSLGSTAAVAFTTLALAACGENAGMSQAEASGASQGEMVTAVGCPTAGPQPGCVTIKAKGKVYDISSAGVDMSRNVAVSLSGRAAGEVTACGAKLAEVKLEYQGFQCAAPAAPTAATEETPAG